MPIYGCTFLGVSPNFDPVLVTIHVIIHVVANITESSPFDINIILNEGRITRKNLVHFRKNLKQKSYRKIQKSYKNPKNL